jgi:hypothetical protein
MALAFYDLRRPKTHWGNPVCHLRNYGDACSKGKYATGVPIMQPLCVTRMRMSRHARYMDGSARNHAPMISGMRPVNNLCQWVGVTKCGNQKCLFGCRGRVGLGGLRGRVGLGVYGA